MFSQYVFVKQANGRYYYRSHGCTLEWDLSFTVERLWQYTGHGLPVPPGMEPGDETLPNFYNVRVTAREYKEYAGHTAVDDITISKDDVKADSPEAAVTQVVQDNGFHNGPRRISISGKWIFLDYVDEEGNDHYVELDGELGDYAAPVAYDRRLALAGVSPLIDLQEAS